MQISESLQEFLNFAEQKKLMSFDNFKLKNLQEAENNLTNQKVTDIMENYSQKFKNLYDKLLLERKGVPKMGDVSLHKNKDLPWDQIKKDLATKSEVINKVHQYQTQMHLAKFEDKD